MVNITIDFSDINGSIKHMNGVNNGPAGSAARKTAGTAPYYKELEIPYARLHDSAFHSAYGGEHTVDVHRIFKNFDADENDPASYHFETTDKYLEAIQNVGTKVFYRLGASIEHGHKVGTRPPKDFEKWARVCEHIIMHYTEGWADGFNYDIEYWEIWNEPDCFNISGYNAAWQGTPEQFLDFFEVVVKYLKNRFPKLKIGGPAMTGSWPTEFRSAFYKYLNERNIPIDFYTYHTYLKVPDKMYNEAVKVKNWLAENNKGNVELFVDEWNYVRAWFGDDYSYSMATIKGLKGASVVAGTFCAGQASPLDMLMYYEGRPSAWCGLFNTDNSKPLKTYYIFDMFNKLKKLGSYVKTDYVYDKSVYICSATDNKNGAFMITNYSEHDTALPKDVTIELKNIIPEQGGRIKIYKLDDNHNGDLVIDEPYQGDEEHVLTLNVPLFTTYYVEIIPNE